MGIDLSSTGDSFKRYFAPAEKKRLGVAALTMEELLLKSTFKKETGKGGLQDLIRQYLNQRGIRPYGNASHKKSTAVIGQPDFMFPFCGRFVAFEAKLEGNEPSADQWRELNAIKDAGGIALVVYSLDAVKAVLDDIQRSTLNSK